MKNLTRFSGQLDTERKKAGGISGLSNWGSQQQNNEEE